MVNSTTLFSCCYTYFCMNFDSFSLTEDEMDRLCPKTETSPFFPAYHFPMMSLSQVHSTQNNDSDSIQETGLCWYIQCQASTQPTYLYTCYWLCVSTRRGKNPPVWDIDGLLLMHAGNAAVMQEHMNSLRRGSGLRARPLVQSPMPIDEKNQKHPATRQTLGGEGKTLMLIKRHATHNPVCFGHMSCFVLRR